MIQSAARRIRNVLVPLVVVAVAGCGSTPMPQSSSSTPSATTTSASPPVSTASATPSSASPVAAAEHIPTDALATALLPATRVAGSKETDAWRVYESDSQTTAGATFDMTPVGANTWCQQLVDGHTMPVPAAIGEELTTADYYATLEVDSLASIADADRLMTENAGQAKNCTSFKVTLDGTTYAAKHTVDTMIGVEGEQIGIIHRLSFEISPGRGYYYTLMERRNGGEVLHITAQARTARGLDAIEVLAPLAVGQFMKTVDAYRKAHPRTT